MSSLDLAPVLGSGAYAQQGAPRGSALDRAGARVAGVVSRAARPRRLGARALIAAVAAHEADLSKATDAVLRERARALRAPLRQRSDQARVAEAFALVRESARRHLEQRHHDVQVHAGWVLLHGMVAEMDTGEGKTLAATLPAATAALAGVPTHIVTVNDYLAGRDAQWMEPVYAALGLRVGVIQHGLSPPERRAAYACDVTYCTNKELAFDYLRDRITLGPEGSRARLAVERVYAEEPRADRLLLRGLHYAIVDEADSVLVDEARTPLIISDKISAGAEAEIYGGALALARDLARGADFEVDAAERGVLLSASGRARLDVLSDRYRGVWRGRERREELVRQALSALHLFERDRDYLVRDGEIQIVDAFTGRVMADRAWEQGTHQLIELKEGLDVSERQQPVARISYQRFFRRYLRLAGMTGTAREVAGELGAVYALPMVRIPTHRPPRRARLDTRVFETSDARWDAVVERVRELHAEGRPVLVGTRSVAASEEISSRLDAALLRHRVLNARQDADEAEIVAQAGERGRITVATNMAGRGTDIQLGEGVALRGGLHVIAAEHNDAARIDRQLWGRCGRQGDPGSHEQLASLEDDLFCDHGGRLAQQLAGSGRLGSALRFAQRHCERMHRRMRRELLHADEQLDRALAFAGPGE